MELAVLVVEVSGLPYPCGLIASGLERASHIRLCVGTGAGSYEHEWRTYGFPEVRDPREAYDQDAVRRFMFSKQLA